MDTTIYTAKHADQQTHEQTQSKRVLCVEDDPDTCEMMSLLLNTHGYEVTVATSVDDALELSRRGGFDLYVLDNWLPQGNGVELCEKIRKFNQDTPIIFYTGAGFEVDIKKGMDCGAQAYLVKPDIQRLIETITRLLNDKTKRA